MVVAALFAWYVFGFAIPYWYAERLDGTTLQKSGQFGDGFNAAKAWENAGSPERRARLATGVLGKSLPARLRRKMSAALRA